MKKITAILLLFSFLVANTGVAVTVHYCGGKLSSIDFFSLNKHRCKCGKKAMKPNCCKDKTAFLKMKDDLAKTNHFSFKIAASKFNFTTIKQIQVISLEYFQYAAFAFYYPPLFKPKTPIYLLDRAFLI